MKNVFKRAKSICDSYPQQDFDINRFEHDVECLENIATFIGAQNVTEEIYKFTLSKDEIDGYTWFQLKELGNVHFRRKEWTKSMNCYSKAIRLNKIEAVLYSNRARCEFYLKKYQLAFEDIEDAISLDPNVTVSLILLFKKMDQNVRPFQIST